MPESHSKGMNLRPELLKVLRSLDMGGAWETITEVRAAVSQSPEQVRIAPARVPVLLRELRRLGLADYRAGGGPNSGMPKGRGEWAITGAGCTAAGWR